MRSLKFGLLIFAAALCAAPFAGADTPVVKEIRVENLGRGALDKASVLAYVSLNESEPFDRSVVNKDVKALQRTGRFSQVEVKIEPLAEGVALIFEVRPKLLIRRLTVTGADYYGNHKVAEMIGLAAGDRVDEFVLGARAREIEQEYREKYFPRTEVTWEIEELDDGRADVRIAVDEGARSRVRRIEFTGNTVFSDSELRSRMKQKRFNPFNPIAWLTGRGKLDRDVLAADLQTIRTLYRNRGYLDVQARAAEVRYVTPKRMAVDIHIDEGLQYRVGDVRVEGIELFDKEQVTQGLTLEKYDVASAEALEAEAQKLRDFYGIRGYVRTSVRPVLTANATQSSVDIRYEVKEGAQAYVKDVKIRGNQVTQDKVIRRELVIYPGDLYNDVRVRRSERRLMNLGYFSLVNSYPEATADPEKYDVVFEVEEQQMGQMALGAGFSSVDELTGFFEISHGNFDLTGWPPVGAGQKVKARTTLGTERTDYDLSFVEPWFLNRKLALGVDLFSHDKRFLSDEYDQQNEGLQLSLSKSVGRFSRLSLTYAFENIDVYNVRTNASLRIQEEEGLRSKSAMTLSLTRDTRDNYFLPSRGNRTTLSATYAGGVLAGDTEIYSLNFRSSQYWTLWWNNVLSLRARAGVVDSYGDSERVPIFDRYFLGGAYTIRGFRFRDVGPIDEEEEPLGGNTMAFATLEYSIPTVENIRLACFYDTGMVWEDAYDFSGGLNSSYGVGIRFDVPMLPLRFDYSWPLETDPHNEESGGRFSFVIGYVN